MAGPPSGSCRRFPASRFVGFDIDTATVTEANESATAEGLANLRFEAVDASELPEGAFDVVCMFDAFHHMTDPDAVLVGIRASLRPGGSLLLAEAAVSGDAATDAADPTAALVYGRTSSTASRRAVGGRSGLGATWPGRGWHRTCSRETGSPRLGVWNRRPATW